MKKSDNKSAISTMLKDKMSLPWLIVTVASMVVFIAFLVAMYFGKLAYLFFGILILIVGTMVLLDGIYKKKQSYLSGNLNFIMVALCVVLAVVVISRDPIFI
ncbi:MAG: hypothetical protein MJ168_02310 [Clostridia bacterium]|nr:hypothetical protein [Clostridia bacterium]